MAPQIGSLERLQRCIERGSGVPALPEGQQPAYGGSVWMDHGSFAAWRTQGMALLEGLLSAAHPYRSEFARLTDFKQTDNPTREAVQAGLGVLRALAEDLELGLLDSLRGLVSAELFADFISMANALLGAGYHHAATSIAGAVLEDALRRRLHDMGSKSTGNLESLNQVALDKQLYTALTYQQLKVWIGLRNHADHGEWELVSSADAHSFLRDLPGFLEMKLLPR
jgi:hypothetical protein